MCVSGEVEGVGEEGRGTWGRGMSFTGLSELDKINVETVKMRT